MKAQKLTDTCERMLPSTLDFLRRMVGVNSFTTNSDGVNRLGRLIAGEFAPLGFVPEFFSTPRADYGDHLVLKRRTIPGAPTIALISHLDTVFSEEEEKRNHFQWRDEGARIFGPGTNDIKGGTSMIFLLLTAIREEDPELFSNANWVVLHNACEETNSEDFGKLCRTQLPSDTRGCLIFEADGAEGAGVTLVAARKGRATFEVRVEGHGAHAGGDHARGANAVAQLAGIITRLDNMTDYDAGLTVNVSPITGGTVLNRVPHEASVRLEMRAFSPDVYERCKKDILALSGDGDVRSRDGLNRPCRILVHLEDETVPWPRNAGTDGLIGIWQEAGRELGFEVGTSERGGLSDGNVIWDHFPTLDGLGPRGDNSHCSEQDSVAGKEQEWVDVPSIVPKTVLNILAVKKLARPAN